MRFSKAEKINLGISVGLVLLLVAADQWIKTLAVSGLKGFPGHSYLHGLVVFEYAENRGAFLSLGATLSESARLWIFTIGVIFIIGFCLYSLVRSLSHRATTVAFSLVIAGGVGNLIDRVAQGYVVDYVYMGFPNLRTGVLNLADVAISAGLVFLVILQYRGGLARKTADGKSAEA